MSAVLSCSFPANTVQKSQKSLQSKGNARISLSGAGSHCHLEAQSVWFTHSSYSTAFLTSQRWWQGGSSDDFIFQLDTRYASWLLMLLHGEVRAQLQYTIKALLHALSCSRVWSLPQKHQSKHLSDIGIFRFNFCVTCLVLKIKCNQA